MKTAIHTDEAPQAIGAYSQAIQSGNTVYISGQIPLAPETMTVIDGDFKAHTRQVFTNLNKVTQAASGSLNHIVKLTVYLTDLANFAAVNEVMAEFFTQPYPARAVIGVNQLPKDVSVEIDAIMVLS